MTMTSGELLIALYDGILKQLHIAQSAFQRHDIAEINHSLQKAQCMIGHLDSTLDDNYEISSNLHALYDYFLNVICGANLKKDPAGLEDVVEMIAELRSTYMQADRLSRTEAAATAE